MWIRIKANCLDNLYLLALALVDLIKYTQMFLYKTIRILYCCFYRLIYYLFSTFKVLTNVIVSFVDKHYQFYSL